LDAGCGEEASLTALLARRYPGARFVAADLFILTPPEPMPPNLELREMDILQASFTAPFDTVYSLDLLEHVEDPGAILRNFHGWMRPGGRLYLHTPAAGEFHFFKGALEGERPAFREVRKGDMHMREGFQRKICPPCWPPPVFENIRLRRTFSPAAWLFKELYTLGERRGIPGIGLLMLPFVLLLGTLDRLLQPRRGNGLWVEARRGA